MWARKVGLTVAAIIVGNQGQVVLMVLEVWELAQTFVDGLIDERGAFGVGDGGNGDQPLSQRTGFF